MAIERTFAMIKPDGVKRKLTGEIITRMEHKGWRIIHLKQLTPSKTLAEEHYNEHRGKPFFESLVKFLSSGPVIAMCLEGEQVISEWRRTMGATKPWESTPGTIRFQYATTIEENIVHGSDTPENATRELNLWFKNEA